MTTSPRGADELVSGQAIPETTVNEIVRHTEAGACHFPVVDKDLPSPPGSCADGANYIVAATATGLWAGWEAYVVTALGANAVNGWRHHVPIEGFTAYLQDENARYLYGGSSWAIDTSGGSGGTVTTVSVASANGFAGSVATATTTPAITMTVSITGLLKGNGTAISAAAAGTDYYNPGGTDVAVADGGTGASTAGGARTNLGATTVGGNVFTLTNPSAITFLRVNADNTVDALSASAFRTAIGAGTGTGSGDLVSTNNLSDLASVSTALSNLGLTYSFGMFFTTAPTTSEVLLLHIAATAFTLPANFATPTSKGVVGTNPAGSFAIDVQRQVNATGAFSSIGTITISTGGAFTFATASGTSKSIAVNDVLKFIAPSSVDASVANVAITIIGSR